MTGKAAPMHPRLTPKKTPDIDLIQIFIAKNGVTKPTTAQERRYRNAGIASLLAEGRSWSFIQDMTSCSRATVAKIAKRIAPPSAMPR